MESSDGSDIEVNTDLEGSGPSIAAMHINTEVSEESIDAMNMNSEGSGASIDAMNMNPQGSEARIHGMNMNQTWISKYCSFQGNEFLCEVDYAYILDEFNLNGLSKCIPHYRSALNMILGIESSREVMSPEELRLIIEPSAMMLYGLIHARYILTENGMAAMLQKFLKRDFESCPSITCDSHPCLPVGLSDLPSLNQMMIYCPRCKDIYVPRSRYTAVNDGAFIGTTFPHLFLMEYPQYQPIVPKPRYVPRVFGFNLHNN